MADNLILEELKIIPNSNHTKIRLIAKSRLLDKNDEQQKKDFLDVVKTSLHMIVHSIGKKCIFDFEDSVIEQIAFVEYKIKKNAFVVDMPDFEVVDLRDKKNAFFFYGNMAMSIASFLIPFKNIESRWMKMRVLSGEEDKPLEDFIAEIRGNAENKTRGQGQKVTFGDAKGDFDLKNFNCN